MSLDRARSAVLDLLERRHGVGARAGSCPQWVMARLDRALTSLSEETGGWDAVVDLLRRDPTRLSELADVLRVGETRFFRDPAQWQALETHLPELGSRVRALSVGCSTGEEAWSLAMLLDAAGIATGSVVGMDRSDVAIESARTGLYPVDSLRHLPQRYAERYLTADGEGARIVEPLRSSTRFVVRDVMLGPPAGSYEIVVCKNVLIYFGQDAAERVVERLLRSLSERGVLLVARSEVPRVRALGHASREIGPGVTAFIAG